MTSSVKTGIAVATSVALLAGGVLANTALEPESTADTSSVAVRLENKTTVAQSTSFTKMNSSKSKKSVPKKRSSKKAMSVYEWRRLDKTPLKRMVAPFKRFVHYGGTKISLDLSYVVDLSEISNAKRRKTAQHAATKKLRAYVKAASKHGLEVEALAGDPRWAEPEVRYVNQIVQQYVTSFNRGAKTKSRRLVGSRFDIEPWGRTHWAGNRTRLTREYLETVQDMVRYQRSLPKKERVPITVDLPFWWDGTVAPRTVRFAGKDASPTAHVMRLLDTGKKSGVKNAVSIMAYRDRTAGSNGSLELVKREFAFARKRKGRVKVVVAQEIGNVKPAHITFHQEGSRALKSATKAHIKRYSSHKAWGGVAVDHLAALDANLR